MTKPQPPPIAPGTRATLVLASALICALGRSATAQEPVRRCLLPASERSAIASEISSERAYQTMMQLEAFQRAPGRYDQLRAAAEHLQKMAQQIGLSNVRLVEQKGYYPTWSPVSGEVAVILPSPRRITSFDAIPWSLAAFSRSGLVEARVVDVGRGTSERDYRDVNPAGSVVLASGPLRAVVPQAIWRRGALGVISYQEGEALDLVPASLLPLPPRDNDAIKGAFAFSVSRRDANMLRQLLLGETGSGQRIGPVMVRSRVDADLGPPGSQLLVEAVLPGQDENLPELLLTARLEDSSLGATSGSSGCAALLEIGRCLHRLASDERIPRPRRTIRMWWVTGISGIYEAFATNPDQRRRLLAAVHIDGVGEVLGESPDRATALLGTPLFRPSFLDDLARATFDEVSASSEGTSKSFRPELPYQGYFAGEVPEFLKDWRPLLVHDALNDTPVGVPAVSLATIGGQGGRPAGGAVAAVSRARLEIDLVFAASLARLLAHADEPGILAASAAVVARSRIRLSAILDRSTDLLADAQGKVTEESWWRARNLLLHALLRERTSVASLVTLVSGSQKATDYVASRRDNLWSEGSLFMKDLTDAYAFLSGVSNPKEPRGERTETRYAGRIPELRGALPEHLQTRTLVGGLSADLGSSLATYRPLAMAVLSAVDGRRSVPDILHMVQAASDLAGGRLLGEIPTLEKVLEVVNAAKDAGSIEVRDTPLRPR
jgi:hypothetical protein